MQRRKKKKENEREKLFQVKRKKCVQKEFDRADIVRDVWSRGVARWVTWSLSVADPFVCRCLTSSAMLPFPHPAHRTGRADLPHPALGEDSRNRRSHRM